MDVSWKDIVERLPTYKARLELWYKIVLKLQSRSEDNRLEKALVSLRSYCAPDGIWGRICSKLDALDYDVLDRAIKALPRYQAPAINLSEFETPAKESTATIYHSFLQVAAAVIVGVLLVYAFVGKRSYQESTHIVYSEEYMEDFDLGSRTAFNTDTQSDGILNYLNVYCNSQTAACSTDRFKMLYAKYLGLLRAQQEIKKSVSSQDEMYLTRYKIRIEKQRTEVGKDLIAYFIES